MSSHRALVVDDSRTAQHRLKRMLKRYDITVETAISAEEALGYLTHTMPAVIFMDHHMKGMDGLEALKIIKANPTTAMIPVIMYTSQSGDVYVGRAHALGALDILSKEVIKPSSLEAVLGKLRIHAIEPEIEETNTQESTESDQSNTDTTAQAIEHENNTEIQSLQNANEEFNNNEPNNDTPVADNKPEEVASDPTTVTQTTVAPTTGTSTTSTSTTETSKADSTTTDDTDLEQLISSEAPELRQQVARLFELHIADVRTQITENTKFMVRRLTNEIKTTYAKHEKHNDIDPVEVALRASENARSTPLASYFLLAVILIVVIAISVKIFQPDRTGEVMIQTQTELSSIRAELQLLSGNSFNTGSDELLNTTSMDVYGLLDAIGAAADFETQFDFNTAPINADKQLSLQSLIDKMYDSGFKGFIEVTVHTGNFCVSAAENGDWVLAAPDTPVAQCVFSKNQPTEQQEAWLAEGYSDLEAISDPIKQGDIELAITLATSEEQKAEYPELQPNITAQIWNNAAIQNNYLRLRFESSE